jgi:eukaryotic-like serine/threonine-protein kinase
MHTHDIDLLLTRGAVVGPFGEDLAQTLAAEEAVPTGARIGPYRVLGELGRGGMAVVYLAERADGSFAQRVALKLIKRGVDTDEVITRFLQERQILASFNHPNVARLVDGGIAPDGRPFFAMEFVDGEPIDQFCDSRGLTVDERLDLCVAVGRAVQYAHRALVVHRDLKPSNILITPDREVKLLDFGIAKLLHSSPEPLVAPRTQAFVRVMTPEYASPEQIKGEAITTASDVYQLGLLMFELLTGHKAQPLTQLGAEEAERVICGQDPPRPSSFARDRAVAIVKPSWWLPRWRRRARGLSSELDDIVLTALRKEPDRRYASVDQLVEDIMRYQRGLPIAVRGSSWKYRSRKFLRRNAAAIIASTTMVAVLAGLIAFYSIRLTAERDRARQEAEAANAVATFAAGLFEPNRPSAANQGDTTARELLSRGADRITKELAGQPDLQARLMVFMGGIQGQMGLHQQALPLLQRGLEVRRATSPARSLEVAMAAYNLGWLLDQMGRYREAQGLLEEALSIRVERLGAGHIEVAKTLNILALLHKHIGSLDEARRLHERALIIQESVLGPDDAQLAMSYNNLALLHQTLGNHSESRRLFERAVAIHERNNGPNHVLVATSLMNLADAYRFEKNYAAARPLMERAIAIIEKTMGSEHRYLATAINSLANLLNDTGQYADAQPLYHRAIAIYEKALPANHPDLAYPLRNLGNLHRARAEYAEALKFYERSLEIRIRAFGREHLTVAQSLESVGATKLLLGDTSGAEPLLSEALVVARKTLPPDHMTVGDSAAGVGWCHVEAKRFAEAEPLLLEAYRILVARRGAANAYTQTTRERLITLYERWGKPEQAAQYRNLPTPKP